MAVFSKEQIFERLHLAVTDDRSLVISPLLQAKYDTFDSDSVDLRLGTLFLSPQAPPPPFFSPGTSKPGHQRLRIPLGYYLVVPAHETVLGATLEFIKLPNDVSAQILTKSSVARTFVVIETAPWIHPGYRGCLTLEIANVSNTPLLLYPGRLVAQMVLFSVPKAKPADKQSGTYLGPVYPEAPVFRDPKHDLALIGVGEGDFRRPTEESKRIERCPECLAKVKPSETHCAFCHSPLPPN